MDLFHGIHMDYSIESRWTCPWNPWWICLHSIWNPVESIWNSDGFHMELTIPWPFHDHSTWNPWCPWNNELAVVSANIDSMDSRWNSRWIHGFQVDSIWIIQGKVKTSTIVHFFLAICVLFTHFLPQILHLGQSHHLQYQWLFSYAFWYFVW